MGRRQHRRSQTIERFSFCRGVDFSHKSQRVGNAYEHVNSQPVDAVGPARDPFHQLHVARANACDQTRNVRRRAAIARSKVGD